MKAKKEKQKEKEENKKVNEENKTEGKQASILDMNEINLKSHNASKMSKRSKINGIPIELLKDEDEVEKSFDSKEAMA